MLSFAKAEESTIWQHPRSIEILLAAGLVTCAFFLLLLFPFMTTQQNIAYGKYQPQLRSHTLRIEPISNQLKNPTTMAFLGPDDILVLEKNGTVQRIVNGQLFDDAILDVNVNVTDERGMLGIAVANNNHIPYVFLYYTEAKVDGGEPIGNRLYRYEFIDNKLINPKLLLDLPYEPGPAHNGGVIAIGPDNNLYLTIGDLTPTQYGKGDYKSLAQNYRNGKEPDGRGGILHLTQDGHPVNGKGILGDEYPLNLYYAYGIRNSYGIAFDPVTGKLWDTENGPSFGDEVNLVEPGFNSGWAKVIGRWEVNELIDEDGNREVNKGQFASSIPGELVNFNGKGKYSAPRIAFNTTIGPTSIAFLGSNKLGKEYENDLFVGSAKEGILHFDLNKKRRGLVLDGPLADKIADNPKDIEKTIFANNFSIITDIKVGPDGYLYVVSGVRDVQGNIYRIVPS